MKQRTVDPEEEIAIAIGLYHLRRARKIPPVWISSRPGCESVILIEVQPSAAPLVQPGITRRLFPSQAQRLIAGEPLESIFHLVPKRKSDTEITRRRRAITKLTLGERTLAWRAAQRARRAAYLREKG